MKMSDWEAAPHGEEGEFLPWPSSLSLTAYMTFLDLISEDRAPNIPSGCEDWLRPWEVEP